MTRVLLADDSPHAQRMGERILTEEGFEVVTVSDGSTALLRLEDTDPDVVLADCVMPGRSGYEICQFVRLSPRHRHTRVILTVGAQEALDDSEAGRVKADGVLKKPFEATALVDAVRRLAAAAAAERGEAVPSRQAPRRGQPIAAPIAALIDPEQVRAAVTVALNAAMPRLIDEISEKLLIALNPNR